MDLRDFFHMVFGTSLSRHGACRGLCRSLALIVAFDCARSCGEVVVMWTSNVTTPCHVWTLFGEYATRT